MMKKFFFASAFCSLVECRRLRASKRYITNYVKLPHVRKKLNQSSKFSNFKFGKTALPEGIFLKLQELSTFHEETVLTVKKSQIFHFFEKFQSPELIFQNGCRSR